MSVLEDLTEDEAYLFAILDDKSGLDLAEFTWVDQDADDGCFRCWPFQWKWFRNMSPQQIDQCARAIGKSLSIKMRAFAFPFIFAGREMVVTGPEGVHVDAITDLIETQFYTTRLGREMLVGGRFGIKHKPFHMNFANGARIMGRIPQNTGKGVKGVHPVWLELDEAQDYPPAGWTELIETLNRNSGKKDGVWRAHGVTRGVRDRFYDLTDTTNPENRWTVHRYCLPGDTLVYGVDGPVPIQEIKVGQRVHACTSDGDLAEGSVTALIDNGVQPTWEVRAKGGYSLTSTFNHPYLVLDRAGTRKTRRVLGFEWVEAASLRAGDVIVCARHLPGTGLSIPSVEQIHATLDAHSPLRSVPEWVWTAAPAMQMGFLHGYLLGDGSLSRQSRGQNAWQVGTASKRLAKELRALCHYLGLRATRIETNDCGPLGNGPQYRFCIYSDDSWFNQIPNTYSVHDLPLCKNFVARTVGFSAATGQSEPTFDITVDDQHNFIAEGVVVHNTAMHRPGWDDDERQDKIALYGSKDDPDYRRNVLGLHGDATNPIFVLHRLMQCVDDDLGTDYNADEYHHVSLSDMQVAEDNIVDFLEFPYRHVNDYTVRGKRARYWCGMDIGFTRDPSEILVFVEHSPTERWNKEKQRNVAIRKEDRHSQLKLLTRITLKRIKIHDQASVIKAVMEFYRPEVFAMDKAGNGLGLYQMVMADPAIASRIKGYNHSAKEIVEIDEAVDKDPFTGELVKDAYMKRNMLEFSTDKLRELVDAWRIYLPWDKNLIGQFQGATETARQRGQDAYGRSKTFSSGEDHALDACRMGAMAFVQETIDEILKQDEFVPVMDRFVSTW